MDGTEPRSSGEGRVPGARDVGRSRRGRHRARPSMASAAESLTLLIRRTRGLIGISMLVAVVLCVPRITSEAKDQPSDARALEVLPRIADREVVQDVPPGLCPIDWRRGTPHIKRLIRCAASHYGVDEEEALYIAWRESRYRPAAYNETGDAAGIYQHKVKYWAQRAVEFGSADWSVFDARANILVTMRMVRVYGWEPWSL